MLKEKRKIITKIQRKKTQEDSNFAASTTTQITAANAKKIKVKERTNFAEFFIDYYNLDKDDHDNHFAVLIEDDFNGGNFRK